MSIILITETRMKNVDYGIAGVMKLFIAVLFVS